MTGIALMGCMAAFWAVYFVLIGCIYVEETWKRRYSPIVVGCECICLVWCWKKPWRLLFSMWPCQSITIEDLALVFGEQHNQIKWPDLWDLSWVCVSTHRSTPFLNNSKIKSCWSSQVHVRFTIPIFVWRLLQGKSFFNHCQTAERENRRNEMGPNPELPG